jgi:uncharacterized membrane protein YedE/YeeE
MKILLNFLLGLGLGYALHRSRFCFAGVFRDYILFKDTGLLKALLVSLALSTGLFGLVQYITIINGMELPGDYHSIGLYTVLGGFLFGIGMIMAGGCSCSIFIRLGEGFKLFTFVLIGLMIGSIVGAYQQPLWEEKFLWVEPIFLGEVFWWPAAVVFQVLILLGFAYYLSFLGKKTEGERDHVDL